MQATLQEEPQRARSPGVARVARAHEHTNTRTHEHTNTRTHERPGLAGQSAQSAQSAQSVQSVQSVQQIGKSRANRAFDARSVKPDAGQQRRLVAVVDESIG